MLDDVNRPNHGHFPLYEVEDLDPAIGASDDDEDFCLATILFDDNPVTAQKGLPVSWWPGTYFCFTVVDVLLKRVDLFLFIDAISVMLSSCKTVHETSVCTHNGEVDNVV